MSVFSKSSKNKKGEALKKRFACHRSGERWVIGEARFMKSTAGFPRRAEAQREGNYLHRR
jgi:hypothetical protein